MRNLKVLAITSLFTLFMSLNISAQELSVTQSSSVNIKSSVNINELPEYVIVTSENTKFLGGINIMIDYKKSTYKEQLEELEDLLQARKKLSVRNQTDLLNAMSKLGFDYLDAYNADSNTFSGGDSEFSSGSSKFRVNMVFRKKEKFRN